MTIIAWDGRTLATDRKACKGDMQYAVQKLFRERDGALAIAGDLDCGLALIQWYRDGADPAKWPVFQQDKDRWSRLVVLTRSGLGFYEREPILLQSSSAFLAWGSGSEIAIGAMAAGADARRAVEIASEWSPSCGLGVDSFSFQES